MAKKDDAVSAASSSIQSSLGALYDGAFADGVASVPAGSGGFQQSDIDAAVASAQGVDAQALAVAQAQSATALAALQGSLDAMTAKEQSEEAILAGVQDSFGKLQAALAAFQGLFPAPPAPPASA